MTEINPEKESSTQDAWKQVAETAKATAGSLPTPIPADETKLFGWLQKNYATFLGAFYGGKNPTGMSDLTKAWGEGDGVTLAICNKLLADYNNAPTPTPPGPNPPGPKPPTPGSNIPLSSTSDLTGMATWNAINTAISEQHDPKIAAGLRSINAQLHGQSWFNKGPSTSEETEDATILLKKYVQYSDGALQGKTNIPTIVVTPVDRIEYTVTQKYNSVSEELTKSLDSVKSKISMMQDELTQLSTDKEEMVKKGASKSAIDNLVTTYNHKIKTLTGTLGGLEKKQKTLQTSLDGIVKNLDNDFAPYQSNKTAGANKEANKLNNHLNTIEKSSAFTKFTKDADTLGTSATNIDNALSGTGKQGLQQFNKYRPAPKPGNLAYFDIAKLHDFVDWSKADSPLDKTKLDAYLKTYVASCKDASINSVNFAFSQLNQIDDLDGKLGTSMGDIAPNSHRAALFTEVCSYFHTHGIQTQIAFGGGNAQKGSFNIVGPGETGETAKGQADKLAHFMETHHITNADFDIESAGINPDQANAFFTELHTKLGFLDKTTSLTVEGSLEVSDKPIGILKLLSSNNGEAGSKPTWQDKFDNINLMNYAYGSDVETVSAQNPEYGMEAWAIFLATGVAPNPAKALPNPPPIPKNEIQNFANVFSKIHEGFTDDVDYKKPAPATSAENGKAAGDVFKTCQSQVTQDWNSWFPHSGVNAPQIGTPFFWAAEDDSKGSTNGPDAGGMYGPTSDPDFYNSFFEQINQTPTDSITGGSNEFGQ